MGTYSGYAEFYVGYALAVEINIGAHSDPDHERDELARRQAALSGVLAPAAAAAARAYAHYADGLHAYRRYTHLLERAARDYTGHAPEPLWASERRSRGAQLPLARFCRPQPAPDDVPLSLSSPSPDLSRPLTLTLYLQSDRLPYLLREVIDGHLIASQFSAGGLFADCAGDRVAPEQVVRCLQDAVEGLNRHSLFRLLDVARANRDTIEAVARGDFDPSPAARLVAEVVRAFLSPAYFAPGLSARTARETAAATLLATLAPDSAWAALQRDLCDSDSGHPLFRKLP